jgi:hypothetical protein
LPLTWCSFAVLSIVVCFLSYRYCWGQEAAAHGRDEISKCSLIKHNANYNRSPSGWK